MSCLHRASLLLPGLLLLGSLVTITGCDLNTSVLLQNYDDESDNLKGADVRDLDLVETPPALDGGTYVGTLGPSDIGSGDYSGATFTLTGTGERICLLVDPQSVWRDDLHIDGSGSETDNPYMLDFTHDDGDIDLLAGLASYYTGTPGELIGDFFGSFPDDNGVNRAVDLNLCLQQDYHGQVGGTAGRASPEACSFETEPDTAYRIVLQVFSVPQDDNELKYALEARTGECPVTVDECTLRGDFDDNPDAELPQGYTDVESMYCEGYDE